eukprot:TRINITY_DN24238_c0_g1_i1.p1 TRINITY_DN24238_c0_g1~~TRINITY_DN24238_c0_g1_i1.p1  ORF type:complete len:163 (-),score=8.46 TRINITY_DN24238_c0_g1_i1:18-470(-)
MTAFSLARYLCPYFSQPMEMVNKWTAILQGNQTASYLGFNMNNDLTKTTVRSQAKYSYLSEISRYVTNYIFTKNDILKLFYDDTLLNPSNHVAPGFVELLFGPVNPILSASTTVRLPDPEQCTVNTDSQLYSVQECLYPMCTISSPCTLR